MTVSAGTAFVGIEGDFSELNKQVSGHFSKLGKQASDAGKKAGAALGGAMKVGVAGAGVAAGGLFMKGLNDAISAEKANAKLAAQLGSTKATSKKMGKVAGKVYADAYGDSLEQVNDAIRGIVQNDIAKKTGKDVEGLTKKTLDLASAFDQDVGDATRGVGQLMRTKLVKDADQAFDIITKGFQKGGDKAGDLIDTLNEYSTQWRKLGINAETATGLITQGLQAGARDSDIVADAIKEFSLRATGDLLKITKTADGPKTSLTALGEAFKAAGYDADSANPKVAALADKLQKDIAGGGEKAKKGLQIMLDSLRKTNDPLDRSRNAVALFGTQAEDLGDALYALDPSKAVDALGKVEGAADKLGDTLNNNTAARFEELKRKTFAAFQGAAAKYVLPEFDKILKIVNDPKLTTGQKFDAIMQRFGDAIKAAEPVITKAVEAIGPKVASAFIQGFLNAPVWVKLLAGGWLMSKLGGASAFKSVGATAGSTIGAGMAGGVATSFGSKAGVLMKTLGKNVLAAAVIAGVGEGIAVAGQDLSFSQKIESWFSGMSFGTVGVQWSKKFEEIQKQVVAGMKPPKMDAGFWNVNPFADLDPVDWEDYINQEGFNTEQQKILTDLHKVRSGAEQVAADLAKNHIIIDVDLINDKDALRGIQIIQDNIEAMKNGVSGDVSSVRTNVRLSMKAIRRYMDADSDAGKQAISANFSAAIANIQTSMGQGTISVKEGTALIQEYMTRSLMNFGFTHEQALNISRDPTRRTSFTGGPEEGTRGPGKQRGGFINMGAPSGDSVHAMLERDEYVLNRKAVRKVGKAALDRLNFGDAPRFQRGGSVTGDTDVVAALLNALKAMSASVGQSIFIQSGRRTMAEQEALARSKGIYGPGNRQGAAAPSPNAPHVRGIAADITPGSGVFGSAAGRFGLAFNVPGEPWHIALVNAAAGAAAQTVAAVAQKVAGVSVTGPNSALKTMAQSAIDATQGAAQGVVDNVFTSLTPPTAALGIPSVGGAATGNGADLMKQISSARGWNFADWWALDARESSHGANLANPTSSARLRGQFMDFNYGKYGPGSDPAQNPSMSQQIQSMAAYIAERYGNPTRAWAAWQSHYPPGWYQRGGGIGSLLGVLGLQKGGSGKYNVPEVKVPFTSEKAKKALGNMVASKPVTTNASKIGSLSDSLGAIGYDRNMFDHLADSVDIDAQWADVAAELTDATGISEALQLELEKRQASLTNEQRASLLDQSKNMLPSEKSKFITEQVFPAADQKKIVDSMQGRVQGKTQLDWLAMQLGDMLGLRNLILVDTPSVQGNIDSVVEQIRQAKALSVAIEHEINKINNEIEAFTEKRRVVSEERQRIFDAIKPEQEGFDKAQKDLAAEHKKKKPSQSKIKSLTESIGRHRNHLDSLHYRYDVLSGGSNEQIAGAKDFGNGHPYANKHWHSLRFYDTNLHQDRIDRQSYTANKSRLDETVIPAFEDRQNKLETARDDLASNLIDLQGRGSSLDLMPVLPDLGVLAGKFFSVQSRVKELTNNPPRISAEVPSESSAPPNPADEILKELLRQANLRTSVSEAQFDVFKNLPFGGSFKEGGTVPGPVGAPRMILAHGGEVVIPNDSSAGPNVSVSFANGMEWLQRFVDIRVDNQTRTQSRRSERQLPGQPGLLR